MSNLSTPNRDVSTTLADMVRMARGAQATWIQKPIHERLGPVKTFRRLLVDRADAVVESIRKDVSKSVAGVLSSEVLPTADAARFMEKQAARILAPRQVPRRQLPFWMFGQTDVVHRRPRGVVAVIGTWNYPLLLNGVQILQALTAGNAVLWKPSEVAPSMAPALHGLLLESGYPPELVQMTSPGRELGPAVIEADIDFLVFTGGADTGRRIAARLGERLIPSTLELSGCDSQFVLDDADVTLASRAAWFGTTINNGQTCIAVRRAFVHRSVYALFCDLLRDLSACVGPLPLAMPAQTTRAERLVKEALSAGGRLLVDGPVNDGGACRPAVIADARSEMSICREDSFAPVMAVIPFDDLADAQRQDASCPYALAASIFTKNTARAQDLAAGLRAGSVTVNDVIAPTVHPGTPFGGSKASGWGVTQGEEGLLELTVPQAVSVKAGTFRPHYDLAAGRDDPKAEERARALLEASHAPTLARWLNGWRRLIRVMR
jgi:acyl-CoA reductase-like NAD-dependent aldehyde dehydrogenase